MKVAVIGTGYVGLVTGTCFAELGHKVSCIDISEKKIAMLKDGKCPIYEPGLSDLLTRNIEFGRLFFTTDYKPVAEAKVIFLAVGTPSGDDGSANLSYLFDAAKSVAKNISDGAIVVIKSTVPVGTSSKIKEIIASGTKKIFYIVSNPEFLKEGTAVEDFMRPDRVLIGYKEEEATKAMEDLYAPLVRQGNPIYKMSNLSAEMSKYAANCFLATKISFINEVARLCDLVGADIEEVRKGIMSDKRIGSHFLYPGPGYGGSCFPKDVKALIYTAREKGMELSIVQAVEDVNDTQKTYMFEKMKRHFEGNLRGKIFAFWGVAFKPNTDDIREAPAIDMAKALLNEGAEVRFFDPVAMKNFSQYMENECQVKGKITAVKNKYDALDGSSGLVIMTEWREFKNPDFEEIKARMKEQVIFDARNIYLPSSLLEQGFSYYGIGRKIGE